MNKELIDKFWNEFSVKTNCCPDKKYVDVFSFDLDKVSADILLGLVLSGKKRATASSLFSFKEDNIPQVGDFNILTDGDGNPHCIIRTTQVTIRPFKDITVDMTIREGENETVEEWRNDHRYFFIEEGKMLGYEFSEDMPVVFEDFEVLYQK